MTQEVLSVDEAIKVRHSVRTFNGLLSEERRTLLNQIIAEVNALPRPFGSNVEVGDFGPGLGTLGVISNEAGWLLGKIKADTPEADFPKAQYDIAYLLHTCVLKMTQNKFASVWIAGTFNEKMAEEKNEGYKIPAVVAYGEDAQTVRFLEKAMKFFAGSSKRYPLEKLFYDLDNKRPFTKENSGDRLQLLEAVQSGPSAMNIQAWRLAITGDIAHLYKGSDHAACAFDIGIAIAAMKLLLGAHGHETKITQEEEHPAYPEGTAEYICTLTLK
ncbi:hypothetical protein TRFO_35482 [Tritrichomonas foetus]|uniref:Putative nitroreductase TM1586 domain-containing protein n=1 Tax=Tritrichomonas foetus TaxID=1144522 RepID=A0A1J4JKP4_9EUKA|nr:hypothetical protein TRFO_35482 [Tritrichomonas foetus]|eukprot:OHS98147.1 hypothetical protein TRFO_35482 [Tritrichomonas foetus]